MLRFLLFPLDIPFFCFGKRVSATELRDAKEIVRPGDIILCADRLFPVWQLVVRIGGASAYSHAGVYTGEENVIEATTYHADGSCVANTDIDTFLSGYKSVCIVRPPYGSYAGARQAVEYARRQIGKPYDNKLNYNDNNTAYCTELAAKAIAAAGITTPVTSFCGRRFYMPDSFLYVKGAAAVYSTRARRCMLSHVPFAAFHLLLFALMLSGILSFAVCTLSGLAAVLLYAAAGWIQYKIQCSEVKIQDSPLGILSLEPR